MNTVNVTVSKLLETLRKNRETHIAEYNEALKGYREACIAKLKENLDNAIAGKDFTTSINIYKPQSYEKDYSRAISMLEWSTETEVELSAREFDQYVNDEWQWAEGFKTVNSMYLAKAA